MSALAGRGLDPPHHHMADGPARYARLLRGGEGGTIVNVLSGALLMKHSSHLWVPVSVAIALLVSGCGVMFGGTNETLQIS